MARSCKIAVLLTAFFFCVSHSRAQIITTIAGGNCIPGMPSGDGGPATSAFFGAGPTCFDGKGNMYICDDVHNSIRKINAITGIISTIAGLDSPGYNGDNIPAVSAKLFYPYGIAVDNIGNVIFSDHGNSRIRKIDASTGVITTIAGNGIDNFSGDNGLAINAQVYRVSDVKIDKHGNIYLCDFGNQRVRKIGINDTITTIAGGGPDAPPLDGDGGLATNAYLLFPTGICFDSAENLFISCGSGREKIRKVNTSGIISTIAGNGTQGYNGEGIATQSWFLSPTSIMADKRGNVFVADGGNNRVRIITPDGYIATYVDTAGNHGSGFSGDNGWAGAAFIQSLQAMSIDDQDNLYLSTACRIRKVTPPPVGISLLRSKDEIRIFPNPASDYLQVQFKRQFTGSISIYNTTGQLLQKEDLTKSLEYHLAISAFPPGLYFLKIRSPKGPSYSRNFTKQ